ncbi:unnamed protein product [Leuciscus chuanchicus]
MEIEPFLKVLPDDDSISIADLEDLFVPQTESPGYLTGVDEQQMAAGIAWMKYWERPLLSRVPESQLILARHGGVQEMGWSHMSPMKASLTGHLDPPSAFKLSTVAPKPPQRSDQF